MVLGTAGSGSCLISLIPACLGAPLLEFGTAGAATAPVLVLAPMVAGGMLVFRSCLGAQGATGRNNCNVCILCLVPLPFVYKLFVASQLLLLFQPC